MLITDKAAFGYKFLLPLFLVGMFASNVNAAIVVPVDWLNDTNSIITFDGHSNVYEYTSDHSAAGGMGVPSERVRLGNFFAGYVSGTVTLPSVQDWQLNFYVVNDESAASDVAAEYVKLSFDGSEFSTIFNTTPDEATLITYDFYGDSFDFYFEFNSPIALASRHLVVETGIISVIPVPAAGWLFGAGLLGLVGVARRRKA